ncbi:MAG: BON domain-containing protein [Alphaproteobacteria bacterium]|nr:BON domain-containing protein [Alphaproteobacteria bacterium]
MNKLYPLKNLLTVLVLIFLTGCAAITGRETAGEYIDDATITARVKTAILDDPSLKPFQISVETFKNVVQLSGFVDSAAAVSRAGQIAITTKGVESVKNNLVVRKK